MPATAHDMRTPLTHEAYFQLEQCEDQRYEYLAGEVFAMAGGSESHALIAANTIGAMIMALRGRPCRVYGSDMKLRLDRLDKFCYPDLMVLCEQGRRTPRYVEAPRLIVEVLSESTESYDRGLKFEHYRTIPELSDYLLLDQARPHAELFTRQGATPIWTLTETTGLEGVIALNDWGVELALTELYRDVDLKPKPEI
jgi:Uma2 family endonuclease